jgi:hypothetical protein
MVVVESRLHEDVVSHRPRLAREGQQQMLGLECRRLEHGSDLTGAGHDLARLVHELPQHQ